MATTPGNNPVGINQPNKGANFKLKGHTASVYGSDPNMNAMGAAGAAPRDLQP